MKKTKKQAPELPGPDVAMKNQVQLITYVDRFGGGGIQDLRAMLNGPFEGAFGGVHLLPFFFAIDGADLSPYTNVVYSQLQVFGFTALICVAITDRPTAHQGRARLARK